MAAHVPMLIARRGVRSIVERHPSTTKQYKFAGISARSMEIPPTGGFGGNTGIHAAHA